MRVRFWGTRGSVPSPGPGTVRYGGNTSCVEVRTDAGGLLVIDCGTGARALGQQLLADDPAPRGSILISHTHWDHIHGLPFFAPLFTAGSRWDVYGPRGLANSLDRVLAGQMEYQYFPVALEEAAADVEFHDLVEGVFEASGATITTRYLNHPALTLGYRIEADDAVVVFASDHEQHLATHESHVAFLAGADLVIHDAQYETANYASKQGHGHSTMEYVVDAALEAGVGCLALYHHDPNRDDDAVDDLLDRARGRAAGRIDVIAATEGVTVDVAGRGATTVRRAESATRAPALAQLRPRVVVACADPALDAIVRAAAAAEGLVVDYAGDDGRDAVVVVDTDVPVAATIGTGASAVVPIGLPCSVAYVRTKLRAAVLGRASRWVAAPVTPDEDARLAALHRLGILDTPVEERFDRLAESARAAADTPIALITLVDGDRQWFKSHLGYEGTESHRDTSMCAHAIFSDDVMQVPDTLEDPRFADNPAVTGPSHVRFYAGAPLALRDGSRVGTLCVADHRPRLLDDAQIAELKRLAAMVVAELEGS
ncbi:MAG TPA: MBL fold metallo-hydrolase [Acidimicrobiales bacterium]|nr:MBL fold metallo-hydrolase [Acidimicrobiales bacterium]